MAYDEKLAQRIRKLLSAYNVEEKKMMGGLIFMVNDKMCVGVHTNEIMCRIDPLIQDEALRRRGARMMNFTGTPMRGFVFVKENAIDTARELKYWVGLALDFNARAKVSKKRK